MNPCDAGTVPSGGGWMLMLGPKGSEDEPIAGVIGAARRSGGFGAEGAVGSKVNGVYKPTGIVQNGKPLFEGGRRHQGELVVRRGPRNA